MSEAPAGRPFFPQASPMPLDPRTAKIALRRDLVARILAIDPADRRRQQADLDERFHTLPGFSGARTVLLYAHAFPEEIDTSAMLRHTLDASKRLACPRVDWAARRLRLFHVTDPAIDLVPGTLGIPEPRPDLPELDPLAIDWVLVPGLGFDDRCFRIGRGAGHYDRLLPLLRPEAPRWALAFDAQWLDAVPDEPHDQPLDGVVSPSRTATRRRLD